MLVWRYSPIELLTGIIVMKKENAVHAVLFFVHEITEEESDPVNLSHIHAKKSIPCAFKNAQGMLLLTISKRSRRRKFVMRMRWLKASSRA